MRMRLSNRLALAIAVGVAATSLGAVSLPSTYAAPLRSLTAGDFQPIAQQGLGDPQNSWAWAMQWFNHKLYVGTNRDFYCVEWATFAHGLPYLNLYPPPNVPDQVVPCNADPQAMPLAGEIWQMDPAKGSPITQTNWTRVYQAPYSVTVNITNTSAITSAPRDMAFRSMSVYTETDGTQALYISGVGTKPFNGSNVPPPSLLRTTTGDSGSFQAVPADPGTTMGNLNNLKTIPTYYGTGSGACCMRGQATYVDAQGVSHFLIVIGGIQGAGALFASTNPAQGNNSFVQITPPSMKVFEIEVFHGHLFLGVDTNNGYGVLRTDCMTPETPTQVGCNQSDFTTVVPAGGGLGKAGNSGVTSMHVYTDPQGVQHLYVGTDGASNLTAAELVRISEDQYNNDSWDLIVGKPRTVNNVLKTPLSGFDSGFGWSFNQHFWRMADYQGGLYVGTYDASTQWKGTSLEPQLLPWMGFDLWYSPDGVTFSAITQNGFSTPGTTDDSDSFGARSIIATPPNDDHGIFIGSTNWAQGLRLWQGYVPQSAVQLAPSNVQADTPDTANSLALTWDASTNATLYHVYRSDSTQYGLPKPRHVDAESVGGLAYLPHKVWLPSSYKEIGTSTTPYFVDKGLHKGTRYNYYVVGQDASGNLSAPSNVANTPSLLPTFGFHAGFHLVSAIVARWGKHGKLAADQATSINNALQVAYKRLKVGDAQGSHDRIEQLRQQLFAEAQDTTSKLHAEQVSFLLKRLERRVTLVQLHLVSANHLF